MKGPTFERRVALFTCVGIVATVLILILRNHPFADPQLVVLTRILLSLGVGTLGATIPGFLEVRYDLKGMGIRAGGALALFIVTFFGTPKVESLNLTAAELELSRPTVVDLRTLAGPERTAGERSEALAVVTVPVAIRSAKEPALRAAVSASSVRLKAQGFAPDVDFMWRHFVTMNEERHSVWLGIDSDAHSFDIEPGAVVYREILYQPTTLTWAEALKLFAPGGPSRLEFAVTVTADGRVRSAPSCIVDAEHWRAEVQEFIARTGGPPGRITMNCLDVPAAS